MNWEDLEDFVWDLLEVPLFIALLFLPFVLIILFAGLNYGWWR